MRLSPGTSRAALLGAVLAAALTAAMSPAHAELKLVAGNSLYSLHVMTYRDIPFRTVVRQQYDYSCGSAALATLLRYHYGADVDEATIFKAMYMAGDQTKIRKVGFSLLDMKRYLERSGYVADGYRLGFDELARQSAPAIALITVGAYKHFVVIKGIRNGKVLVGDPALGLKIYDRAAFEKMWDRVVFEIHGGKAPKGIYNADNEWRPYNAAPVRDARALDSNALYGARVDVPAVYQVLQVRSIP